MPNPPTPPSMPASADTYESSSSDPTFKFYQVAVPSFTFNETGDETGATRTVPNVTSPDDASKNDPTSGSSFVRLGSFPDVTRPANGPAGFAASLQLANLVGDAAALWNGNLSRDPEAFDDPAKVTAKPYGGDPNAATPNPDEGPNTYNGDPKKLLGFINDTRLQPPPEGSNQSPAPPPRPEGLAESLVLLTKGGWWDHSDGNRITTTAGDKIEIIQGNYKLVVLGRQKPVDRSAAGKSEDFEKMVERAEIYDVSGGMVVEHNARTDPGVKSIEWTQDEDGSFTQYANNDIGNLYTSFYGKTGELFFGALKEEWTGKPPDGFAQSDFYRLNLKQSPHLPTHTDPDVKEYTWAKSITSYTGSEGKTIPSITEHTFADDIKSYTGSAAKPVHAITEITFAEAITGVTNAAAITDQTTAAAITEETNAGVKTDITIAGADIDITLAALKADVFVGALAADLSLCGKVDVHVGAKLEIDLGAAYEISLPDKWHAVLGDHTEARLDQLKTSINDLTMSMNKADFALTRRINALVVELGI